MGPDDDTAEEMTDTGEEVTDTGEEVTDTGEEITDGADDMVERVADGADDMAIGALAEATGLSAHTLRYYEDQGLIPQVERNGAGHRRYRPEHVRWIGLLDRLRASGMSISRMRDYVELAVCGDGTVDERRTLLETHEADIGARIAELEACRAVVRAKIDLYAGRLEDPERVWELVDEARRHLSEGGVRGVRTPR